MMEDVIRQIVADELQKQLKPILEAMSQLKPAHTKRVLTTVQLAKELNVSARTIYRLNQRGTLDSARTEIGPHRIGYNLDKVLQVLN